MYDYNNPKYFKSIWEQMKLGFIFAIILYLIALATGRAQTIPKGADRIEIKTTLPDSLVFEKLVKLLGTDGYTIARTDDKRFQVTTENRPIKVYSWATRIIGTVKSGVVGLRSEASIDAMGVKTQNEPIVYKGMNGAMHKRAFGILDEFAKHLAVAIPGSTIEYHAP